MRNWGSVRGKESNREPGSRLLDRSTSSILCGRRWLFVDDALHFQLGDQDCTAVIMVEKSWVGIGSKSYFLLRLSSSRSSGDGARGFHRGLHQGVLHWSNMQPRRNRSWTDFTKTPPPRSSFIPPHERLPPCADLVVLFWLLLLRRWFVGAFSFRERKRGGVGPP